MVFDYNYCRGNLFTTCLLFQKTRFSIWRTWVIIYITFTLLTNLQIEWTHARSMKRVIRPDVQWDDFLNEIFSLCTCQNSCWAVKIYSISSRLADFYWFLTSSETISVRKLQAKICYKWKRLADFHFSFLNIPFLRVGEKLSTHQKTINKQW